MFAFPNDHFLSFEYMMKKVSGRGIKERGAVGQTAKLAMVVGYGYVCKIHVVVDSSLIKSFSIMGLSFKNLYMSIHSFLFFNRPKFLFPLSFSHIFCLILYLIYVCALGNTIRMILFGFEACINVSLEGGVYM